MGMVMKAKLIVLASVFIMITATLAFGVPKGKVLEFKGSPMGTVIFDGSIHAEKAGTCKSCHKEGMFPVMKKGTVSIKMADMYEGKFCGACHNGKVTFALAANCVRCHKR
jgi:c(7)-type cytochrome triheme protein